MVSLPRTICSATAIGGLEGLSTVPRMSGGTIYSAMDGLGGTTYGVDQIKYD